ncbi:hypothetical protein [Actinomycetospora straminea]|uniref:Uncharacterized protein n=1 Tax=Actinomycetospora straminea TaxID=663607 RepID=A0ABP9EJM3_9PSEU|nr:hypothetical protein [Actinomycetospora straminea]MDD7933757.1 hypothetical protein [Actinomycetospora straminea]
MIGPAAPAPHRARRAARESLDLLADETPRIQAAALAWRNGLGALLAGLIGFSLIKGRSDVTQLAPVAAAIVGCLLLAALIAGAASAVLLMRAAHGLPFASRMTEIIDQTAADPRLASRLGEADGASRALGRGVVSAMVCAALLCGAVGLTWYGPPKAKPRLSVVTDAGVRCGEVVALRDGDLRLKADVGEIVVDLDRAVGISAPDACPAPGPATP